MANEHRPGDWTMSSSDEMTPEQMKQRIADLEKTVERLRYFEGVWRHISRRLTVFVTTQGLEDELERRRKNIGSQRSQVEENFSDLVDR